MYVIHSLLLGVGEGLCSTVWCVCAVDDFILSPQVIPTGLAAKDGRLRPGDIIRRVSDYRQCVLS